MDEYNSGPMPVETGSLPVPYKDRSTGLVIFGILTLLLGCLAGLFVPLLLFGQAASAKVKGATIPFSAILPAIFIYGALSVVLVWLGIGSMMARRWARALMLILSWSWLVMGVFSLVFMGFYMPRILGGGIARQPALPSAAMDVVMVITYMIFGFLFVILPVCWVFFYQSRHVKATCEARDPLTRWTDACPLPVLALCLWLSFSALIMLFLPTTTHGVLPFFGMFLTGLLGTMFYLAIAAVWSLAAWWLYKLDQRGWWLVLIAMCLFIASTVLTNAKHDVSEMYRLMQYPEAQIEQIQKTGLLTGSRMTWITFFSGLPYLGYILYIKKFFRRQHD